MGRDIFNLQSRVLYGNILVTDGQEAFFLYGLLHSCPFFSSPSSMVQFTKYPTIGICVSVPCPKRFAASPITNSLILTAFSILNMCKEMRSKWVTHAVLLVETV
jgi:hypothetical protein